MAKTVKSKGTKKLLKSSKKASRKIYRKSSKKASRKKIKNSSRKIIKNSSRKIIKNSSRKLSRNTIKKTSTIKKPIKKPMNGLSQETDKSITKEEHEKRKKNLESKGGIEMYDIVNKLPKKYYVTKKDLNSMKGKTITVALFDRNFEEYGIWNKFDDYKLYDPVDFFKNNKSTIQYNGGKTWKVTMDGDENEHFIEVNVVDIRPKNSKLTWMPIDKEGNICMEKNAKKINLNDISNDTRIGWRGPMIQWDKIASLGKKVYKANLKYVVIN